jgi:hypothetical protein
LLLLFELKLLFTLIYHLLALALLGLLHFDHSSHTFIKMSSCNFNGDADMYGVGIRVGFYLQWFGTILASWVATAEVKGLRFINSLFVAATFLALVIQIDRDRRESDDLRPVEIYIILLLTFGGYLYFVPLYIWRGLTCCQPMFDPSRYPRVSTGPVFSFLNFLLLLSVSIFQLWFGFDRAGSAKVTFGCQEYGFFFSRVRLNERGFVVGNILLHFFILLGCAGVLVITVMKIMRRNWLREMYDDHGSTISTDYDSEIDIR